MGQTRTQAAAAGVFDAQSAVERLGADMAEMRTDIAELKNTAAGIREIQSEMVTMEALDALMKKYLPTPVTSGAAFGGVNPKQKPNPRASGTGFRSPGKPVALADITNTGRPNPPRSIAIADVLKENAKLRQELAQLRFALHATQQRNVSLAQANSQMTAELNQGKERLQLLRHELGCATAVIKLKGSGLEPKSTTADNQLQKEVASQELNAAPSKLAPVEAHQAVASVPCNTVLEEGLTAKTNKRTSVSRRTSKRKSESCEGTKDTTAGQPSYKPAMQPPGSSRHEDLRNTLRRRLREALHMDTDPSSSSFSVPELSSSFSVPELHETNSGKDMQKARQGNTAGHKVETSVLNEKETNKQPEQEVNVEEEIQEADPSVAEVGGLEALQTDDKAMDTNPDHLPETQSSLPFNIIKHPERPQKKATKRVAAKRKLESREGHKDSNIEEDATTKLHSTSSEPLHHEETRKSRRRLSLSCEVTEATLEEAAPEDIIAPLPPSSSKILIEQSETEKQNDRCPSTEPSEEQATERRSSVEVTGRRSSMRGAAKAVSYKEIPLNVKMRRP